MSLRIKHVAKHVGAYRPNEGTQILTVSWETLEIFKNSGCCVENGLYGIKNKKSSLVVQQVTGVQSNFTVVQSLALELPRATGCGQKGKKRKKKQGIELKGYYNNPG